MLIKLRHLYRQLLYSVSTSCEFPPLLYTDKDISSRCRRERQSGQNWITATAWSTNLPSISRRQSVQSLIDTCQYWICSVPTTRLTWLRTLVLLSSNHFSPPYEGTLSQTLPAPRIEPTSYIRNLQRSWVESSSSVRCSKPHHSLS
jgi:hypothetical protein